MIPSYLAVYQAVIRLYTKADDPVFDGDWITKDETVHIVADGFLEASARAEEYIGYLKADLAEVRSVTHVHEVFCGSVPEPTEEVELTPTTGILSTFKGMPCHEEGICS